MTDPQLVKIIQEAVKGEVRPLKEQVEIVKNKISKLDLFQNLAAENTRTLQEQQSVINEKLDMLQTGVQALQADVQALQTDLNEVKQTQENSIHPSVIHIESAIKAYADMYKINNSNSKKLDKRLGVVEDTLDIQPPPEFSLAEVS